MDRSIAVIPLGVGQSDALAFIKSECHSFEGRLTRTGVRDDRSDDLSWRIVNRYYDATVAFELFDDSTVDSDEDLKRMHQCPALVVLVDPSKTLSSYSLERLDSEDVDVSLVVAISGPKALEQARREAWDDLCLEHGFEFVDLGQTSSPNDDEDDRGLVGIERVREALQAHAWPSTSSTTPRASQIHPSKDGFGDDFSPFVSAASESEDEEGRVRTMREFLFKSTSSSIAPDEFPDDDPSAHFDFAATLDQLKTLRLRAAAIQDDDERRDFAETVALAFSSHLD